MVTVTEAIILGIIQGITEWLPVSSSGHLAIAQNFFRLSQPIALDVALHFGSLIVILVFFRRDIAEIISGVMRLERKYIVYASCIVAGTIPAALAGLLFRHAIEDSFSNMKLIGISYLFTALILFLSRYPEKKTREISLRNSVVTGLFQAAALLPGISRSGSTISAGLLQGVKREEAARFSFLLAVPAILGASVLEMDSILKTSDYAPLLAGMAASIATGFIFLKLLMAVIRNKKFSYFAFYCLALGILLLIL